MGTGSMQVIVSIRFEQAGDDDYHGSGEAAINSNMLLVAAKCMEISRNEAQRTFAWQPQTASRRVLWPGHGAGIS